MKPLYTQEQYQAAKSTDLLLLECYHCHKPFDKPKKSIYKVLNHKDTDRVACKYCSKECDNAARITALTVQCKQCNKQFMKTLNECRRSKNHFCSRSCNATYHNAHKEHGTRRSKLEKWLETQLPTKYPSLEFKFNNVEVVGSELDIYIPSLNLAFELNGIFHYEPIFGPKKLQQTQDNDQRKYQACLGHQIDLCIIDVSSQKYFKPAKSMKFLEIITSIIDKRI